MINFAVDSHVSEYISLTDIARFRNSDDPRFAILNWMRNSSSIEFLGLWERLHNSNFNRVQLDTFRTEPGLNRFVMTILK
ncbi:DNA-binding protein [Pseudoprevotella muciniphila]|uniref:DNA-binding protein n=1 Tax=Pseudoprevotella muciniphila TaxID=2133944 RepID=A0A5P8E5P5_9BACT|nr:DNA-binding protein [Pseudoprevotella muciniphila]